MRIAQSASDRLRLKTKASTAYDRRDWGTCAVEYAQAGDFYDSACCYARIGGIDQAFSQLDHGVDRSAFRIEDVSRDRDLAAVRADGRWPGWLADAKRRRDVLRSKMNLVLLRAFDEDQEDRRAAIMDWRAIEARDASRKALVLEKLGGGSALSSRDLFHAALILQHGGTSSDAWRARELAMRAVELDPLADDARWLAAAATDRALMLERKPQRFGTQFHQLPSGTWVLWGVDPQVTDAERASWNVPALAEARKHLDAMNAGRAQQ